MYLCLYICICVFVCMWVYELITVKVEEGVHERFIILLYHSLCLYSLNFLFYVYFIVANIV